MPRQLGARVLYRDGMPVATLVAGKVDWHAPSPRSQEQHALRRALLREPDTRCRAPARLEPSYRAGERHHLIATRLRESGGFPSEETGMATLEIAILLGSTRPNRRGEAVAQWVFEHARPRTSAHYTLIDLREVGLPLLDEPKSPAMGDYAHAHTKAWSARIAPCDGFVFVTPEYNHSTCAALKNALDFLYREWNNKAAGFVAYGNAGGARAVEHLRGLCELRIARPPCRRCPGPRDGNPGAS